jgi:predicted RNA-binding protein (virulence factor B family)
MSDFIIGDYNLLTIKKTTIYGVFLDGGRYEILLPKRYVTPEMQDGDEINVFVYLDSEDRLVATTETPLVKINEFAALKVVDTNKFGVFLDWGLSKHLFLPFSQQQRKMEIGKTYLIKVCLDEKTNRLYASSKIKEYIKPYYDGLEEGEEVELIVFDETSLGFKTMINNEYEGLLYKTDLFKTVKLGDKLQGYIKKIRDDGKIDVTILQDKDFKTAFKDSATIIEDMLNASDAGFLPFNDKSDADLIYHQFEMSKRNFKAAIGSLYRNGIISIDDDGIRLTSKE